MATSSGAGGGIVGMLLTGVLAQKVGLIYGETSTFTYHLIALFITAVFTFGGSYALYKFVDIVLKMLENNKKGYSNSSRIFSLVILSIWFRRYNIKVD